MGKTIAAMIDLDTGVIFVDSSGRAGRDLAAKTESVIRVAKKAEDWEVNACAEVNALDRHIRGGLNPVPGVTHLYSYCYTWDYDKRRWTGRGACHNCRQWLAYYK
jgi:hypothetical protein